MFAESLDEMDDSREVVQQLVDEYHAARYSYIIPDPNYFHPSRILDPGSASKNWSILTHQIVCKLSEI
jgi:hypothetical protein